MDIKKNEALLITSKPNIYYFSKIAIHGGVFLLITRNKKFVFTDARFIRGAAQIARDCTVVATDKESTLWWEGVLRKNCVKVVYFEPHDCTYGRLRQFRKMSAGHAILKPMKLNLREMRSRKTAKELSHIRRAAEITEEILKEIAGLCRTQFGVSEHDIALEIHKHALNRGCHEMAFSPIVAFGQNSGIPHHVPSRARRLARGDMILIDMGVKYHEYCSDMTRTFFTAPPTSRQAEIYGKVLKAQELALSKVKSGVKASDLYETAHNALGSLAPHFTHGLGHGVGLEIHEHPNLKPKSRDVLEAGQVITIEPGLYFSWGGVRIEDLVVVEEDRHEILTKAEKKITVL